MHVAIGLRRRLRPAVLSLSVLVLAVAAAAAGSGGRATAQPIEGTWNYGSGQILVASVGSDAYLGTIVKEATFSAGCPHPVGEKVWQLRGSGSHYEGTHEGFGPNGCTDRRTFPSTWDVT
ncbi:MAG: hypothetical protein KGI93_12425, partial [Acidobacteriota bacterium]|nr:hypothetical protein [Acidobacteriota bacterium]